MPTSTLNNKSPFEILHHKSPSYAKLRPFGCLCFPWLRPYTTSKLDPRSIACVFLGYCLSRSAYKCLDPLTGRIYFSRHVKFVSQTFPFRTPLPQPPSSPNPPPLIPTPLTPPAPLLPVVDDPVADPAPPTPPPPTPPPVSPAPPPNRSPRPTRTRRPNPKFFNSSFVNHTTSPPSTLHPIPPSLEPSSVTAALADPKWKHAMDAEFNALMKNDTWELVPPNDHPTITCKWVFSVKRHADGTIDRYKARLVIRGFMQQPGRDYSVTFSPVIKPVTVRIILSIALSSGWQVNQLDINNAFLNGKLLEEVYMVQPRGYRDAAKPQHVCKLKKALYGLKQAPRAWYIALSAFLLQFGFKRSVADASLFFYNRNGVILFFLVYVDDIILTGNNPVFLSHFVSQLAAKFSLKDLGTLNHFLGIEVVPTAAGLFLSQRRYILGILKDCNLTDSKPVTTPMASSAKLHRDVGDPLSSPSAYRRTLGLLQYLSFTRPDITFAVNKLSQFLHTPRQPHWEAVKRVLRYLKGTINVGLSLSRCLRPQLSVYSDADWGGSPDDGRSTTGYLIFLGNNLISWKSVKQRSVSRSSTEAEYRSIANAAAESTWIQHLLQEIGLLLPASPTLFCDNLSATFVCRNPSFHSRMKHLALDYFFVRDMVQRKELHVCHISAPAQIADTLTKPLGAASFLHHRSKMGLTDRTSILRGRVRI